MKVLLLSGGTSNEREVSLRSGKAIANALDILGYEYISADPADSGFDLASLVKDIDVVFLALHGAGGEDGDLQSQLEKLNVPFVGCSSDASKLCFDKWAYKDLLRTHNLPVTEGKIVTSDSLEDTLFKGPYVLKPVEGGSSLDTQIVRNPDSDSLQASRELLQKYPEMLIEPLVEGVEITVGILDKEPLPVIEIVPPEGLEFDYENKYNGATKELCPPENVTPDVQKRAQQLALEIHNLTSCRDMSRTDMIVDKSNNLHVLETNTIPGLTEQSLLPKMVVTAGYTIPEFVDKLLQLTLSR